MSELPRPLTLGRLLTIPTGSSRSSTNGSTRGQGPEKKLHPVNKHKRTDTKQVRIKSTLTAVMKKEEKDC